MTSASTTASAGSAGSAEPGWVGDRFDVESIRLTRDGSLAIGLGWPYHGAMSTPRDGHHRQVLTRDDVLPVGPPVALRHQIGRSEDIERVRSALEQRESLLHLWDPR